MKNELRPFKGKFVVDIAVSTPIVTTIAPGMFKLDIEPISHRLKNNRDVHEVYLMKTIENTNTLRGLVDCARKQNPSEPFLESACMLTKHIQELLVYVSMTCPGSPKPRVKCSTGTSGSKPSGNTKNNRISQPSSSNKTNKVEDQSRSVKSKKNKKNRVDKTECRTFTIVRNRCPLTRITSTKVVPTKEITNKSVLTPTQGIIVYSRRSKAPKLVGSSSKSKITESRISNSSDTTQFEGSTISNVPSSSLINCSLGPEPKNLTLGTISSGLVHNIPSPTPYVPPMTNDWETLFQPMFDEYLNHLPCVDPQFPTVIAPEPVVSTGTHSSTKIDQDEPSSSTSQITQETPSPVIPLSVEEADHDIEVAHG
ncbi:hypothetical protein Tco_1183412 [Tanacetum coccineum]